METLKTDVVVIGSGPGGYMAAIRLGQLGSQVHQRREGRRRRRLLERRLHPVEGADPARRSTFESSRASSRWAIVAEPQARLGADAGVEGRRRQQAHRRRAAAHQGAGAKLLVGTATVTGPNRVEVKQADGQTDRHRGRQGASSSRPARGRSRSRASSLDDKRIFDSTGALALKSVPKRLARHRRRLHRARARHRVPEARRRKLTVVEGTAQLLPGNDPELVSVVARKLKKRGVEVHLERARRKGWEETRTARAVQRRDQGRRQDVRAPTRCSSPSGGGRTRRTSGSRRSA